MVETQQDETVKDVDPCPEESPCGKRRLRSDARRNREKVLAAAEQVLAEQGLDAPIDAIAQHAGVGVGTCYRHFPTKGALLEAIVEAHFESLIEIAEKLLDSPDPSEAYFEYIEATVRASKHKAVAQAISESDPEVRRRREKWSSVLAEHTTKLLERAQEAGAIRDDVTQQDVRVLLGGTCMAYDRMALDDKQRDRAIALVRAALTNRDIPLG